MHCATRAGSASAERVGQGEVGQGEVGQGEVGQGEVGGVTRRVTCTWWLLGLAVNKAPRRVTCTWWLLGLAVVGTGWANSCPGCMAQGDMHMVAARLGC